VVRGYRWLVKKYEKRDRIFLFGEYLRLIYFTLVDGVFPRSGFSRGAYEARVISGMIEKVKLTFQFVVSSLTRSFEGRSPQINRRPECRF
jgi:uncharacterized protein (DUF2235 family)